MTANWWILQYWFGRWGGHPAVPGPRARWMDEFDSVVYPILIAIVSVLLVAHRRPYLARGISCWIAITVVLLGVGTLMSRWGFMFALHFSITHPALLSAVMISTGAVLCGVTLATSIRRVPATRLIVNMASRAALLGALHWCVGLPLFFVSTGLTPIHTETSGLALGAIQTGTILLFPAALGVFFAQQLSRRHTQYHVRHCHRCGYDLIAAETLGCPECDHRIESEQLEYIAQLVSNGPHSTTSSPTAST